MSESAPERVVRTQDESQLQALFEAMPQLGWAARPDGWVYYYNRQWYDFTGSTPEAMAGWGWQSVHNPELLPLVVKRWTHSIATVEPFEMAFQLRRHDGVFRWFLTRVRPMHDEQGTLIRWVGINTDIDDQKQAEETAAAANRAKDEFLAMLGHELRNPLAPIATALTLMDMSGNDTFQRERAVIARQTAHLSRMVDDLLDVSRFLRGTLDIHHEAVDVGQVIAQAAEMVSSLVERKGHSLVIDAPPALTTDGDSARLKQVVVNLLANAAKFTPPGGRIVVSAAATDRGVTIRVRDNGIGISQALLPALFRPFVQKRQSLARSEGGLGLGLAIVRSIVTAHGGSVAAHSEGEGRGSEVVVHLPVVSPAAIDRPDPTGTARLATRSRRILVVDDNRDSADSLGAALDRVGHVAHVEYAAAGALSAAEVFGPEVALLDLGLPDMDGYELARRLREHPRLGRVRIIALTGYGRASDRERTTAAGFDRHLVKPVDLGDLLAAVDETAART
jgi:PAS domain S-box-containing protein